MTRFLASLFILFSLVLTPVFAQKGDTYVVVAGVADYQSISDLMLPEKDAIAIAELYKLKTQNVILLTGPNATKARILKSLRDQFSRAKEEDLIVFSFSGHGYRGGICPFDFTGIEGSGVSYQEIRSILKQSRAKRKVIFADACFSGGLRSNTTSHKQQNQDAEVLLFLSSRGGETSLESPAMENGYFTTYLLNGLCGDADLDYNRLITARELFLYVSHQVRYMSNERQHPVMWGKFDDNYILMDWTDWFTY